MSKLEAIKNVIASKTARQVLLAQKHSPKILFVAGTIGIVGTVVLACRATLKAQEALDDHEKHVDFIAEEARTEQISHEEANKQIRKVQINTAIRIMKPYLPAIGLGLASVAALTGSHVILTKRNGALMATYAALDQAHKAYRQRVATEFGEDVDRKFALGGETIAIEEKTSDGTTKLTESMAVKKDGHARSPYVILFDERSHKWSREPGRNAMTVMMEQSYANDKLRARGHLFLNEALDMLGLPRTKAGAVTGWVYRHDNEAKTGDNYVDFGVFDGDMERGEAFVNGDELNVWLNFNCDGVILDLI